MTDRLKIVPSSHEKEQSSSPFSKSGADASPVAIQAKFDRLWLTDGAQFDPNRNCLERERIARTWSLLQRHSAVPGKTALDLGCGYGALALKLAEAGAIVDALDVSSNALKILKGYGNSQLKLIQGCMPKTVVPDDFYDIVVSTDLIAYLSPKEERLYFAEVSRVVKSNGLVICSTPLDIYTEGALQRFAALAETEFQVLEWVLSYHSWYIRLSNVLKAPARFAKGSADSAYRKAQLQNRSSWGQKWFQLNTTSVLGGFWKLFQRLTNPLVKFLENSPRLLLTIEKLCRFLSAENGISHAIFIGKRHPVWHPTATELLAIEPKHKKQVWE